MIYVYEQQPWEYKIVVKHVLQDELLSERDLNELGLKGWELS
jgi:hypothetical protein